MYMYICIYVYVYVFVYMAEFDASAKQGGKLLHKEEDGGGTSVLPFAAADISDPRSVSNLLSLSVSILLDFADFAAVCLYFAVFVFTHAHTHTHKHTHTHTGTWC